MAVESLEMLQQGQPEALPYLELDRLLQLDVLRKPEMDKAFHYLLRILTNRNVAQYIESDPAAQDQFLTAVQNIPCTTPILTPAPTPPTPDSFLEEASATVLSGQVQPEDGHSIEPTLDEFGILAERDGHCSAAHGDQIRPADRSERNHGDSQASRRPDTSLHRDDEDNALQDVSRKRKQNLPISDGSKSKHAQTGAELVADFCQRPLEGCLDENPPDGQHKSGALGDPGKSTPPALISVTAQAKGRPRPVQDSMVVGLPHPGQEKFEALPGRLRTSVSSIKDEGLQNAWRFFRSLRETCVCDPISATDPRPKQLKTYLENWARLEKSLQGSAVVFRVSKRVHLVELTNNYELQRVKGQQGKANETFTDLLFPELVAHKRLIRRRSGENKVSKETNPYYQAKRKVEYWIRLGTPLRQMVERFGYAILTLLPDTITDTLLHEMRREHIAPLLDYLEVCYPGLRGQTSVVLEHLPRIVEYGPTEQLLVLETVAESELLQLSNHRLEVLLQFSDSFKRPAMTGGLPDVLDNNISGAAATSHTMSI